MLKCDEQSHTNVLCLYLCMHVAFMSYAFGQSMIENFSGRVCLTVKASRPDSQREILVWLTPRSIENNIQNSNEQLSVDDRHLLEVEFNTNSRWNEIAPRRHLRSA